MKVSVEQVVAQCRWPAICLIANTVEVKGKVWLNSGAVIIPGNHASSLLWQKISGNGGGNQMPLNCSTTCLDSEIEIIANWIDQGANNP